MAKKYIVIDIGCIECGEETEILGTYDSRKDAEAKHDAEDYFDDGQHSVEIFEIEI